MHSLANASLLLPETLGLCFSFSFVYLQATKGMRESYVTQAEMDFQKVNGVDQAMQPGSYDFAKNASGPLSTLEDIFFVFNFQTHLWLKLLCCQMPAATTMVPRVVLFLTTLRCHVSIEEHHLFSLVSAIWQTMHFALLRALLRCKTQFARLCTKYFQASQTRFSISGDMKNACHIHMNCILVFDMLR